MLGGYDASLVGNDCDNHTQHGSGDDLMHLLLLVVLILLLLVVVWVVLVLLLFLLFCLPILTIVTVITIITIITIVGQDRAGEACRDARAGRPVEEGYCWWKP